MLHEYNYSICTSLYKFLRWNSPGILMDSGRNLYILGVLEANRDGIWKIDALVEESDSSCQLASSNILHYHICREKNWCRKSFSILRLYSLYIPGGTFGTRVSLYASSSNKFYTYIVQYLYALLFDILHTIYSCKQWSCTLWNCHIYIILYLEIIIHAIDKACNVDLALFSHKLFLNC